MLALIQGNDLGWTSATVLGLAAATVLLLTAFLIRESRTPEPMLELELLRRPSFAAIAVVAFGITASLVAATTYMALYLINTLGLTPFQTGLVFLPLTGASFVAAPIAARLSTRIAPAILVPSGAALIAIGMWAMTGLDVTSDWTHLLPGSIIAGVGLGVTSAVLAQAALAAVPPSRAGMATGTANTFRQIGVAAGVAGLGALFAHRAAAVVTTGLTVAGVPPQPTAELADAVASGRGGAGGAGGAGSGAAAGGRHRAPGQRLRAEPGVDHRHRDRGGFRRHRGCPAAGPAENRGPRRPARGADGIRAQRSG